MNSASSQDDERNVNLCCIVIPVYKNKLSEYEITSLKQCCKILGKYPIIFVTHNKLDCKVYTDICQSAGVFFKYEYFHKKYFVDISGHNALMLSKFFYKKFCYYTYMLVYHLDSYVFRDELEYWCKKGYTYVGAPWLKLNSLKTMPEFYDPPAVGNGGFSLRNIKKVTEKYSIKMYILSFIHLYQSYYNKITFKSKENRAYFILRFFLRFFFRFLKNMFFKFNDMDNNEDMVWARFFQKKGGIPSAPEAMKFAFEYYPEYLYDINNEQLPFGCHGWFIYQNYPFYKKHIVIYR